MMAHHDKIPPKATKAELIEMIKKEREYRDANDLYYQNRVKNLITNMNLIADHAHKVEHEYTVHQGQVAEKDSQLMETMDRLDELQGEYNAAVTQHLEQDTWARMEIERQKKLVEWWMGESVRWAGKHGAYRQTVENHSRELTAWTDKMQALAKAGLVLDLVIWVCAVLYVMVA